MESKVQIEYIDVEDEVDEKLIKKVIEKCFKEEGLDKTKLYMSVTLTNPENIRKINKEHRNIDKETDVLSFPFFEKEELETLDFNQNPDVLGDIVISLEQVRRQAIEYNHSFERELAYMLVHGFYHIIGYDHIEENDKKIMRQKEENILQKLKITRED